LHDVARFHYPSCTDSIKPSLQLLCNLAVSNATLESLFPDNYTTAIHGIAYYQSEMKTLQFVSLSRAKCGSKKVAMSANFWNSGGRF
jgi:hypothetical protein